MRTTIRTRWRTLMRHLRSLETSARAERDAARYAAVADLLRARLCRPRACLAA